MLDATCWMLKATFPLPRLAWVSSRMQLCVIHPLSSPVLHLCLCLLLVLLRVASHRSAPTSRVSSDMSSVLEPLGVIVSHALSSTGLFIATPLTPSPLPPRPAGAPVHLPRQREHAAAPQGQRDVKVTAVAAHHTVEAHHGLFGGHPSEAASAMASDRWVTADRRVRRMLGRGFGRCGHK